MLTALRDTLGRGEPFSGETVNYRKDGSEYYVEWEIMPIRSEDGQITHFLSIQRNVTARKLAEDQLAEMLRQVEKSRNDLGSILNELRIGTVMTDENDGVVFLNAAAQQLFPRTATGTPTVTWKALFALDPENTLSLQRLIQKPAHERARVPVHFDRSDDRRIWLEVDVKDDPRERARQDLLFIRRHGSS
jgi:PAS domain-containing protein